MYITYKTTNLKTGEYYIGSHKTSDINDNYLGSGKLIKESIKKYGKENHQKEILGIFNTREESLVLEHNLIKEKKQKKDPLLLNLNDGGGSFDMLEERFLSIRKNYELNPKICKQCGKIIPFEQKQNCFCNSSCAASYNNIRKNHKTTVCKFCGKVLKLSEVGWYERQFCNNHCSAQYQKTHRDLTSLQKKLLENKQKIKSLHDSGMTYREIAKKYDTSGNSIKELLKGRIKEIKMQETK